MLLVAFLILTACGSGGGDETTPTPTATGAPVITTQPAPTQTVTVGTSVSFTVVATGTGTLTYQWKKAGNAISGANSATYIIASPVVGNTGTYTVTVNNAAGYANSNNAVLTVTSPPGVPAITTQPANQNVTVGQTATFTVVATGTATLHYQWKKENASVGTTDSANLTIANAQTVNAGSYTVTVTNAAGSVISKVVILTVVDESGYVTPWPDATNTGATGALTLHTGDFSTS